MSQSIAMPSHGEIVLSEQENPTAGLKARQIRFPWLPASIQYTSGAAVFAEYDIMNRGRVCVPTGQGLASYTWKGTFPGYAHRDLPLQIGTWKNPDTYHALLNEWMRRKTPLQLLAALKSVFNADVYVQSFTAEAAGAFGDVDYTLSLIEVRQIAVSSVSAPAVSSDVTSSQGSSVPSEGPAPDQPPATYAAALFNSNGGTWVPWMQTITKRQMTKRAESQSEVSTHVVQVGETLWSIALQFYGTGTKWEEIFNANADILDDTAKRMGESCSERGRFLYAGTPLLLPR